MGRLGLTDEQVAEFREKQAAWELVRPTRERLEQRREELRAELRELNLILSHLPSGPAELSFPVPIDPRGAWRQSLVEPPAAP